MIPVTVNNNGISSVPTENRYFQGLKRRNLKVDNNNDKKYMLDSAYTAVKNSKLDHVAVFEIELLVTGNRSYIL